MRKYCAKNVFRDKHSSVIVLQATNYHFVSAVGNLVLAYGSVSPVAVLVCSSGGHCLFDMDANSMSLNDLRQLVPELDAIVEPLISPHRLLSEYSI